MSSSVSAYAVLAQIDAESAKNGRFGAHLLPEFMRRLLDMRRPREDVEAEWAAVIRTRPGLRAAPAARLWAETVSRQRIRARTYAALALAARTLPDRLQPAYRLRVQAPYAIIDDDESRTQMLEDLAVVDNPRIRWIHWSWLNPKHEQIIHECAVRELREIYASELTPEDQRVYPRPLVSVQPRTTQYTDGQHKIPFEGEDRDSSCG